MNYIGATITDVGTVKSVNQDSLTIKIADSKWGTICLAVVCDGLGGLTCGEIASGSVIMEFERWFKHNFHKEDKWTTEKIQKSWGETISAVNKRLICYGASNGFEMGTTVTVVLFIENKYHVMHVGDCRLYELENRCKQITKDQTLISQEVEAGRITEREALTDNRRNILLQCVGTKENMIPCFFEGEIKSNTHYLLCSDGFRNNITEKEIYKFCNPKRSYKQQDMKKNLNYLVELNKKRGEKDNISAILIRVEK